MRIDVEHLFWGVPEREIVRDVSVTMEPGEVVGLLGPNGSGKSSLLRCIVGVRPVGSGRISYDGRDISSMSRRELAQIVAFVEQSGASPDEMTVADVVALGRLPHRDRWRAPSTTDHDIVLAAMEQLGIADLADRSWRAVSGGERQRAHLARAVAQQPRCLVLDEPTNHLDIRHQLELMQHLRACGLTVVVSLHDLGMAARYCDRVVVLRDGEAVAHGTPDDVLTPTVIEQAFGVNACIDHGAQGRWHVWLDTLSA